MISFYPGPSRVLDTIPQYVAEAHREGILSMNHRSEECMLLIQRTISLLKDKLEIPIDYSIYFTSSATECWEIIAQSAVEKSSVHIFNGAFGQKWFDYTRRLNSNTKSFEFHREDSIPVEDISAHDGDLLCITQNETSNGTQVSGSELEKIRKKFNDKLIAVDATSSMAGIFLNLSDADIWFASVQKCFGLPAGLALMICSPKAISRIKSINERLHYNSLTYIDSMMQKWQTPFTPNVLGIYLLMRSLQDRDSIHDVYQKIVQRFDLWIDLFSNMRSLKLLISNASVRSNTVIPVAASSGLISKVKLEARKMGYILGEGYGELKNESFRVANFPALADQEVNNLMNFFTDSGY